MPRKFKPTLKRTTNTKQELREALKKQPTLCVRLKLNKSFYQFLKYMWSVVSPEEFQPNWHIKYVCARLQFMAEEVARQRNLPAGDKGSINDLIINIPPGSTKTTILMIMFPAWCWTRWYWMEFIGLSYSSTLSLESAESNRDLIKSDRYQAIYPDLSIKSTKDQKSNFTILKKFDKQVGYRASEKQGGSRYSTSVGGTLTGFHGHIILIDDPINPEQAVSPVQLESANRWLDNTLPTRKIHKAISPEIYIMQRLHKNDPTGHKLEKEPDSTDHISLPAEIRNNKDQLIPKKLEKYYKDDLLDPGRMGWPVLKNLKAKLGQYGYAGQMGQSPSPAEGGMFKVDRFVVVDRRPPEREIEQVIRYWDKAGTKVKKGASTKSGPAWTAGIKMAKLVDGRYIILNVKRGRWSSEERETIIKDVAKGDGIDVWVIVEQEPGSGGKESAESTIKNLSGFRVKADRPSGNKIYRADPYSVQVNYGNVLLLQADWNKDFIEEHQFFPFSTFKDQVDSSAGAFNNLNSKKSVRILGSKKH